ncbi:MAG TPA: hypothetical protein VF163_02260 [Micromonosporaceae bacterium]
MALDPGAEASPAPRLTVRGFVFGSLGLIVLYVAIQPSTSGALETGGNALVVGLQRWLSPAVAGLPNIAAGAARNPVGTTVGGTGSQTRPGTIGQTAARR